MSDDTTPDADEETPDADRELLAALTEAWGDDPLPVGIVDRADGLLAWADVDAELAALLESASAEPAGTRGASSPSTVLEFQVASGAVVIEVDLGRGALDGQVLGIDVDVVVLERPSGDAGTAAVDKVGRFSFPDPEPGAVRLRIATGAGADVRTDWFAI